MSDARAKRVPRESARNGSAAPPAVEAAPVTAAQIPAVPAISAEPASTARPGTPEPATPEPATPEPATPEPATPEPATPEPAAPEPVRRATHKPEELSAYGQEAWAALAEAQAATARGLEAFLGEMNSFARSEFAAAMESAKAMLGARTFAEAFELNLGYARRSFDAVIGSTAKLSEIGVKTATEAARPIVSRLGDGWKTLRVD